MQNRNTWVAHPVSPVSTAVGIIYQGHAKFPLLQTKGREAEAERSKSHLHIPCLPPWERPLFTCRLQVVVAGPVNTTRRPVGLAQPGHLSRGFGAKVMASQPSSFPV